MEFITTLVVLIAAFASYSAAAECDTGWIGYKDELCLKSYPEFLPYDEAKAFCASQGNDMAKATLVMVKDSQMQELLASYTEDLVDFVWLGSKYDNTTSEFKWEDGEPLTYTNWQEGYPRNTTDTDICIELRPIHAAKLSTNADGKWADANCQRKNLVMCQRQLVWTLEDAVREIIRNREKIETLNSQVVPVGSIYVEYYDQPSPPTLWPDLTWVDITNTYAGLFLRAEGSNSAVWGEVQTECSPRVTQMQYAQILSDQGSFPNIVDVPLSGWSENVAGGFHWSGGSGTPNLEGARLYTETCEVRPTNQAIRIWKRTA